jgi:hypothetical protein
MATEAQSSQRKIFQNGFLGVLWVSVAKNQFINAVKTERYYPRISRKWQIGKLHSELTLFDCALLAGMRRITIRFQGKGKCKNMKFGSGKIRRLIAKGTIPFALISSILFITLSGFCGYAVWIPEGPKPLAEDQFAAITNMVATRGYTVVGWGDAWFTMSPEQRKQLNALLPDMAKALSLPAKANDQARSLTAGTLHYMAQAGLLTEPKVIPHLIAGLKTEPGYDSSEWIRAESLHALTLMTRRMMGSVGFGGTSYWPGNQNGSTNYTAIVQWWENWWKNNQAKHPVYDEELDRKVRAEYFRVVNAIEKDVKPRYAELALFKAGMPGMLPPNCPQQLYENEYAPYLNSMVMWSGSGTNAGRPIPYKELPWLLVACHFEDKEMPTEWETWQVKHPPKNLENFVTCVYSNKIEGAAIYLEVKIASPNKELVESMRKALANVREQPLPSPDEMSRP